MQRPHRRAHLRLWVVLALVVGTLFVLGVALRQERPIDTQQIQRTSALFGDLGMTGILS